MGPRPSILIVDDDTGVRQNIRRVFRAEDYLVDEASCSREMEGKLQLFPFDIVILDLRMPDSYDKYSTVAGFDCLRYIRHRYQDVKVIIFTLYDNDFIREEAVRRGAFRFIVKDQHKARKVLLTAVKEAWNEHMLQRHGGISWEEDTMIRILFLAASPTDQARLRVDEESREIREKLQLAKMRERFEPHVRMAVRSEDLSQALLDVEPRIVHFSGHGSLRGALYLEDRLGEAHPVAPDALAALLELVAEQVECVVLNACYTEDQAKAIAQHIPFVIGMAKEISDKAAIAFSVGFYQAMGAGQSIERAYRFGVAQIKLQGIPEDLIPVLIKKS